MSKKNFKAMISVGLVLLSILGFVFLVVQPVSAGPCMDHCINWYFDCMRAVGYGGRDYCENWLWWCLIEYCWV